MLHIYKSKYSYLVETIEQGQVISARYISLSDYRLLVKNNTSLKIVLKF